MRRLVLRRFGSTPMGTFGRLLSADGSEIDGSGPIFTVEREWLGNQPRVSCIPAGRYMCGPRRFHRGGYDAIEVRAVPGRTHILFHRANLARELEGCIAPGSSLGCVRGEWGVIDSGGAFRRLMSTVGAQAFELEVVWQVTQ